MLSGFITARTPHADCTSKILVNDACGVVRSPCGGKTTPHKRISLSFNALRIFCAVCGQNERKPLVRNPTKEDKVRQPYWRRLSALDSITVLGRQFYFHRQTVSGYSLQKITNIQGKIPKALLVMLTIQQKLFHWFYHTFNIFLILFYTIFSIEFLICPLVGKIEHWNKMINPRQSILRYFH